MTRPASLAEVAERRARGPGQPLWKPLGEFLDDFYTCSEARAGGLSGEPSAPISAGEAAYLAAIAEYLSDLYGLQTPDWVRRPVYFLEAAYWPESFGRAMETICLAESRTAFRRRFIFTEARPLRRKAGPRPGGR